MNNTRTSIDTDNDSIRAQRITNQNKLLPLLEKKLENTSILERILYVREGIFDYIENVKGDSPIRLRRRNIKVVSDFDSFFDFPHQADLSKSYFPMLIKRVDTIYDHILSRINNFTESERTSVCLRFASVVYTLGILTHPYADGNGQTFKIVSYSYLQELLGANFEFDSFMSSLKDMSLSVDLITKIDNGKVERKTSLTEIEAQYSNAAKLALEIIQSPNQQNIDLAFSTNVNHIKLNDENWFEKWFYSIDSKYKDLVQYIVFARKELPTRQFTGLEEILKLLTGQLKGLDENRWWKIDNFLDSILQDKDGFSFLLNFIFQEKELKDSTKNKFFTVALKLFEEVLQRITTK